MTCGISMTAGDFRRTHRLRLWVALPPAPQKQPTKLIRSPGVWLSHGYEDSQDGFGVASPLARKAPTQAFSAPIHAFDSRCGLLKLVVVMRNLYHSTANGRGVQDGTTCGER
jgi:hypothetical protein